MLSLGCAVGAQEQALSKALDSAISRLDGSTLPTAPTGTGWLAGPVLLAATHLESDQARGTDETELSLSFPIKSPQQRRSDRELWQTEPILDEAQVNFRRWYLSGTLRELYARHCAATVQLPTAERGQRLLEEVAAQLRARLDAGSAERFDLLAVQRSLLDRSEKIERLRAQNAESLAAYHRLTGFETFPACDAQSVKAVPAQPDFANHPQLLLLDTRFSRERAALDSTAPRSAPWTVSLVGRELKIPSFSEQQFGLTLTVPLAFGDRATTANRSNLRALHRDYWRQRDELVQELQLRWLETLAQVASLRQRQQEAAQTLHPELLTELLEATRRSRELPIEIRLARMQSLLDADTEVALTRVRIAAGEAMLRQLAGESL